MFFIEYFWFQEAFSSDPFDSFNPSSGTKADPFDAFGDSNKSTTATTQVTNISFTKLGLTAKEKLEIGIYIFSNFLKLFYAYKQRVFVFIKIQ